MFAMSFMSRKYFSESRLQKNYKYKKLKYDRYRFINRIFSHKGRSLTQKLIWYERPIMQFRVIANIWFPEYYDSYLVNCFRFKTELQEPSLYSIYTNDGRAQTNYTLRIMICISHLYIIFIPLLVSQFTKFDFFLQNICYAHVVSSSIWGGSTLFWLKWYREICYSSYYFIFIKLKYKGKSYKWYRKRHLMVLRFGYSHAVLINIPDWALSRKAGKMKLIFFGTCSLLLKQFLSSVICWKPMNVYNGRGLRFSRQLVFRKFGKVSAYR